MFATAIFVSFLAVATAVPTNSPPSAQVGDNCGNANSIHCCDTETGNKISSGVLSGLDLSSLLGQCNDITATVIGAGIPIKNACSTQVCCGHTNQNGLVNLGCTPISL
uniref:Hydrophobin n=1 Tax=Cordyceps farinosa TaxID=89141 RepID=E0WHQ7_9HYPO|nr:fungal hydrophobin [Cordyceps farinosa]